MNMHLIMMEGNYVAADADDSTYNSYYIIKFTSSTFDLQVDLSIIGQVVYSSKMIREGTYCFLINFISHYYV